MSSQLDTMLMEETALKHELDHLENAQDASEAAKQILAYIDSKQEIFIAEIQPDNEWFSQSKAGGGCCTIM